MVAAARLNPGNSATHWARPTRSAWVTLMSSTARVRTRRRRDSTNQISSAPAMSASATLRGVNLQPGEYRFPFGSTTAEMTAPAFVEKMKAGPVGTMTIRPSGELNMGAMLGQWFVYALVVGVLVAYVTGRTRGAGAPYLDVFRVSGTVAFCCHAVAHWQNRIWWGKGARYTLTYSADGLLYALVTAGAFGWLWPR